MAVLNSLCLSPTHPPPSPLPRGGAQPMNLSAKPATLKPSKTLLLGGCGGGDPLPLPELLPSHVKEKILCLEIMGVDSGRALSLNPSLRSATLGSIHAVVSYLLSKGIHHKDMGRILGMCPRVLTADVRSDLSPVFRFLSEDLGVPDANFRRAVNKCPRLLVSSVRDQLKPALAYLQSLGFEDTEALAYQDPVLLVSSVEGTLIPKLEYLVGLGFAREEAVGMVLRCPGLFTFSVENNFKPKYGYFAGEMGGTLGELVDFPQYFGFSLEKRIKPRHRELEQCGVKLPLSVMLKSTDDEFREMVEHGNTSSSSSSTALRDPCVNRFIINQT